MKARAFAAAVVVGVLLGMLPASPVAAARPAKSRVLTTSPLAAGGQSITINPTTLDFGTVLPAIPAVGSNGVVIYVNNQSAPAPIFQTLNIVGPNASQFYITQTSCAGQVAGCAANVFFVPDGGAGLRSATLLIYDDQAGSPQSVTLKATIAGAAVKMTPASLSFGNVLIGTSSPPQTVTVTSTGANPVNISSFSFYQGSNTLYRTQNDSCTGKSIAPGSSCTVDVVLQATGPFPGNDQLRINDGAPFGPGQFVDLSGGATGPPSFQAPSTFAFGGLNVGVTQIAPIVITSGNGAAAPLTITSESFSGANPGNFAISADNCVGAQLFGGQTCEVDVAAHANSVGASYSATLTFTDNNTTPDTIAFTSQGVNASASVSPASINFGTVPLGSSGVTQTVTLTSNGPDPLGESGTLISGQGAPDFHVTTDNCIGKATASGSTCTISVTMTPTTRGGTAPAATLTIDDSTGTHQVALSGSISGSGIFYSESPLNFGTVVHGSPATKTETITNQTASAVTFSVFVALNYGFTQTADNCTNVSVAPGSSCTFNVVFDPNNNGFRAGYAQILPVGLPSIDLLGTGQAAQPQPMPYSNFPNTPFGTTSQPKVITFVNQGKVTWNVTSIVVVDTTHFGVAAGTDHCSGASVAPGASCSIGFTFSPSQVTAYTTNLTITSNAPVFFPFQLYGVGITPWAGMTPTLAFGTVEQGMSATRTVTVRNIMEAPLHVTGATAGTDFSLQSQTCQNVPRGGACQIVIQYAPTANSAIGPTSTVVTLTDDELVPKSVSVTANNVPKLACTGATLSASPGPNAAVGNAVVFYAGATPCQVPQFQFELTAPGGSPTVMQSYSPSSTWTWETTGFALGSYLITVQVRDVSSNAAQEASTTYTEQLTYAPCGSVTMAADRISPVQIGTTVVWTASASICGVPTFQFWVLPPGSSTWVIAQPYSISASYMWSTVGMPAGVYRFIVWARDANSPGTSSNVLGSWDAWFITSFLLTTTPTCNLIKGSVSPAGTAVAGQTVTINVTTLYCPNPNFQFWMLPPGSSTWLVAQFYNPPAMPGAVGSFSWNTARPWPNNWVGGVYRFVVWARDMSSPGVYSNSLGTWDTSVMFSYYLQPTPCTSVVANPVFQGPTLYLSGVTSGCANPLYEFWVLYPGAGYWTLLQAYSPNATTQFNFAGQPGGRYYFQVWVRDQSSPGLYTTSSYGTYDAYDAGYVDN